MKKNEGNNISISYFNLYENSSQEQRSLNSEKVYDKGFQNISLGK